MILVLFIKSVICSFQLSSPSHNKAQLSTIGPLDRESIASYHMIATVTDNGGLNSLSSTADIFVTVLDINDHAPVFDLSSYSIDLVEETSYSNCLTVNVSTLLYI